MTEHTNPVDLFTDPRLVDIYSDADFRARVLTNPGSRRCHAKRAEHALWHSPNVASPSTSTRMMVGGIDRTASWIEADPLLVTDAWPTGTWIEA